MTIPVVLVHGIRASRTMFRTALAAFDRAGVPAVAIDLPGHGARAGELITLDACIQAIDDAVATFDEPVMLVGHSMGGYLSINYAARSARHDGTVHGYLKGLVPVDCTTRPRGLGRAAYAYFGGWTDTWPDSGKALNDAMSRVFLPRQGRADLNQGGFPPHVMTHGIATVAATHPLEDLADVDVPVHFVNGTWDHLRLEEQHFMRAARTPTLWHVRGAHHVMPLVKPVEFNRVLLEIHASLDADEAPRP